MTRDWLLTLLAMSPYFLAATIVVLALIRQPAQIEQGRPVSERKAGLRRTSTNDPWPPVRRHNRGRTEIGEIAMEQLRSSRFIVVGAIVVEACRVRPRGRDAGCRYVAHYAGAIRCAGAIGRNEGSDQGTGLKPSWLWSALVHAMMPASGCQGGSQQGSWEVRSCVGSRSSCPWSCSSAGSPSGAGCQRPRGDTIW